MTFKSFIGERNFKQEHYISILATGVIAFPPLISLIIRVIRQIIVLPYKIDTVAFYGIIVLLVVLSFITILKRLKANVIVIIGFLILSFCISFLYKNSDQSVLVNLMINFLLFSVPALIIMYVVKDYKLFLKYFNIGMILILTSVIIEYFFISDSAILAEQYSQQQAYLLLYPSIFFFYSIVRTHKMKLTYTTLFLITTFLLISMGARGPLLTLIAYMIFNVILLVVQKRKFWVSIPIFTIIALYFVFQESILTYVYEFIVNLGLSTRTIERLLNGTFFLDSSRMEIYKFSFETILDSPLIGFGLGNDRIVLSGYLGLSNYSDIMGMYSHNILLEILMAYGLIFGILIIIWLCTGFFITLHESKNNTYKDILVMFLFFAFVPLLFSGSFLESPIFFSLIGIALSQHKRMNWKGIK